TRFLPSVSFDPAASRTWFSATSRIFAGQSLASATPRAIDLLIGVFFGVAAVGYLRVATKLNELAVSLLVNPLGQLWVVLLTRARESKESMSAIFLQLSSLVSLTALPGFIGLALVSRELVALVLKPEYAPVADMLMVLGWLGLLVPLNNSRNAIFTATRRFNKLIVFSAADLLATVAGMLLLSQFGSSVMLAGAGLGPIMMIIFAMPMILQVTHTEWRDLVKSLVPPYVAVLAMALGVFALEPFIVGYPPLQTLLIKAAVGAAIYLGMLGAFFRRSVFASFKLVAAQ
ncbi:MAG: hypothetical protein EON61_13690, partial [Alphaproteobacteria bacterium]